MWDSAALNTSGIGRPDGGFLNNTNNFPSPSKVQEDKRRTDRMTNIVPCTVAQALNVPETEEHLKIAQLSAHIVTVVGFVQAIDSQPTKLIYLIDDMSGKPIEAQLWIVDGSLNEVKDISKKSYVRVTGALRTMRGKRHIIIFKIRCITDLNELTNHILEVIHSSMSATVMSQQSVSHVAAQGAYAVSTDVGMSSVTGNNTVNAPFAHEAATFGLNRLQQMVLQAITACKGEHGANINDIVNALGNQNKKTILDTVDFLSNEGHIYSSIDDDHYKSTSG